MNPGAKKALKIGGIILGGIAVGTGIVYVVKKSKQVKLVKDVKTFGKSTVGNINIIETARQLGIDLGTAYGSLDPRSWTENDDKARDALLQVPKSLIPQLEIEYAKLYKRNLQADVQKNLDDYDKVRYLFL